jgi:hypothetical protein
LNITEDEFVLKQLQERDAKKKKLNKKGSKATSDTLINSPETESNVNKRKATSNFNTQTQTKRATKDIDVALALRSLQTVIDSIDDDQRSNCSSEEF